MSEPNQYPPLTEPETASLLGFLRRILHGTYSRDAKRHAKGLLTSLLDL